MFHKMLPDWSQSMRLGFLTLHSAKIKVENGIAVRWHLPKVQNLTALNDSNARFLEPTAGAHNATISTKPHGRDP
jgi:hypothetical protein